MSFLLYFNQTVRIGAYPFLSLYFKFRPLEVNVLGLGESLAVLKQGRKSFVRYGDGEIKLIDGGSIYFQEYDADLAKRLKEILDCKNADFLIGMSDVFSGRAKLVFNARVFWASSLFLHRNTYRTLPKRVFANTFLSRPYLDYKNKNKGAFFDSLRALWSGRDVVFIEGCTTRNGVGNDLYENAKSIKRIICPSNNAYSVYREIESYVESSISKNDLILLSLGPAAKVIAYDLYLKGYQAMDLGHLDSEYEWFLSGSKRKIKISGKHTAENMSEVVADCTDEKYLTQIIRRFV
ncbi:MAG: SP_1767 family glycosyltransferase [Treponema sp.]|nr:SP_1767 family glycosyltransferase [Treponema sp.]